MSGLDINRMRKLAGLSEDRHPLSSKRMKFVDTLRSGPTAITLRTKSGGEKTLVATLEDNMLGVAQKNRDLWYSGLSREERKEYEEKKDAAKASNDTWEKELDWNTKSILVVSVLDHSFKRIDLNDVVDFELVGDFDVSKLEESDARDLVRAKFVRNPNNGLYRIIFAFNVTDTDKEGNWIFPSQQKCDYVSGDISNETFKADLARTIQVAQETLGTTNIQFVN